MQVVASTQQGLSKELYSKVASYRHKVFVELLGWQLSTHDGLEQDQFDGPDTIYLFAQDEYGNIGGCARLLPTTQPYLLKDVFP